MGGGGNYKNNSVPPFALPRRLGSRLGLTVRPPTGVVVDHVVTGVQFLAELVHAVALGEPAGEPGDDHVVGLKTELVGQHVWRLAGVDGGCGRGGRVRGHCGRKKRKLERKSKLNFGTSRFRFAG